MKKGERIELTKTAGHEVIKTGRANCASAGALVRVGISTPQMFDRMRLTKAGGRPNLVTFALLTNCEVFLVGEKTDSCKQKLIDGNQS